MYRYLRNFGGSFSTVLAPVIAIECAFSNSFQIYTIVSSSFHTLEVFKIYKMYGISRDETLNLLISNLPLPNFDFANIYKDFRTSQNFKDLNENDVDATNRRTSIKNR